MSLGNSYSEVSAATSTAAHANARCNAISAVVGTLGSAALLVGAGVQLVKDPSSAGGVACAVFGSAGAACIAYKVVNS
ncbi:hypothetical protein HOH87_04230 [bacterium]|jgi:hypothetical protein|nr:hypothetical protein [bacterium]